MKKVAKKVVSGPGMTGVAAKSRWICGLALIAVSLSIGLVGCGSGKKSQYVSIDGSSTVYPISEAVAEKYREHKPKVRVTVGFSGTGGGFKKFVAGTIDICDASRPIKQKEIDNCAKAGVKYIQLEVAFDGLAVVVNPQNDWCDNLTVGQLKELWQPGSAVKKWKDLNPAWPDKEVKLYGPGTDSGTFDYFTKTINGEEGASRADYTASEDDNVLVTGVQQDKYALGYFGYAYYSENKEKLKLLGVSNGKDPVKPSIATVRDGSYAPLSRPLYIYVREASLAKPHVKDFVQFYLDNAVELAGKVGYVPVSDAVAKANEQALAGAKTADKKSADKNNSSKDDAAKKASEKNDDKSKKADKSKKDAQANKDGQDKKDKDKK